MPLLFKLNDFRKPTFFSATKFQKFNLFNSRRPVSANDVDHNDSGICNRAPSAEEEVVMKKLAIVFDL